jgi:mRNA interferase HigB
MNTDSCLLTLGSRYGNLRNVRIVSEKRIREFIVREPLSANALWQWADAIECRKFANTGELKTVFGSASFVGDLTVFNVGGNKYRVLAFVHYHAQILYIKAIGTHKE